MTATVLSAGIVIVRWLGEDPRYLLLRAYNYWDFPKGEVDTGETALDAALREVEEETTLTRLDFRWGYAYRETTRYRNNKIARYYVAESTTSGEVSLPVSAELGHPEHHEYRWLEYHKARERLVVRLLPILDWAHDLIA